MFIKKLKTLNLRTWRLDCAVKAQYNGAYVVLDQLLFDDRIKDLQQLLEYVNRWGGTNLLVAKTNALMRDVKEVRSKAATRWDAKILLPLC